MAVSAFRSSSKRGNPSSSSNVTSSGRDFIHKSPQKAPIRRSRSVSAFSRTSLDVPSEFSNKRDNPLFWSSKSPLDIEAESQKTICVDKFDDTASTFGSIKSKTQTVAAGGDSRRGRAASRNADLGSQGSVSRKEISRSMSRVDAGRRNRSVSIGPVSRRHCVNSESENEQESKLLMQSLQGRKLSSDSESSDKKGCLTRSNSCMLDQIKSLQRWSNQPLPFESSDGSVTMSRLRNSNWEDVVSTASSLSGCEEKTIKAVCEQIKSIQGDLLEDGATGSGIYETVRSEVRRAISDIQNDIESAIWKSNATAIAATDVADISPDLVNPAAVELVLDIRREYAKKLEQSQERARKLRADLSIEEHRGQELERILKEILPDPKTPNIQKSRPARKASIERRKNSKCLQEEAMAYFDECVSLSTFDSSDFSSPEDPTPHLAQSMPTAVHSSVSLPQARSDVEITSFPGSCFKSKQDLHFHGEFLGSVNPPDRSPVMQTNPDQVSTNNGSTRRSLKYQFSLPPESTETSEIKQNIRTYIRKFEKDICGSPRPSYYYLDEYNFQASEQSLLVDRVLLKNRIECGSLLLCGGGGITFSSLI